LIVDGPTRAPPVNDTEDVAAHASLALRTPSTSSGGRARLNGTPDWDITLEQTSIQTR
jgi:hypothetical protein